MRLHRHRDRGHRPAALAMSGKQRAALAFAGLLVLCTAAGTLSAHRLHYANWWGGAVFAPFAVVIGLLALIIAVKQGFR